MRVLYNMKEQNIITDKKLCWMRDLVIKLKSKIYNVDDLVFGTRNSKNEYLTDQLNIELGKKVLGIHTLCVNGEKGKRLILRTKVILLSVFFCPLVFTFK